MSCNQQNNRQGFDFNRREFLSTSLAAAGVTLASGVTLYGIVSGPEVLAAQINGNSTTTSRWGMLIDADLCIEDCNACVTACASENGLKGHDRPKTDAQWIRKVTVKDPKSGNKSTMPVMCQHCEEPPCVDVCPTGASFKRKDGIVLVDKHICIGCRYCIMACPYQARSFVHEVLEDQKEHAPRGKGTVESCTLCVHRVDEGKQPACVEACDDQGKAMLFGDLNDADSEISKRIATYASQQIRADLGVNPAIHYRNI